MSAAIGGGSLISISKSLDHPSVKQREHHGPDTLQPRSENAAKDIRIIDYESFNWHLSISNPYARKLMQ